MGRRKAGVPVEQGVERGRERVDVGRHRRPVPRQHLGRHVLERAGEAAELHGGGLRPDEPGDAEVAQLHVAVARHQDVLRLHVAVQDPGGVGGGERLGQPDADGQRPGPLERALGGDLVGQGPAGHVLHDEVGLAQLGEAGVVDGDDGRVARQRPHGGALALEAGHGGLVERGGPDHLDGDVAVQLRLVRPVDDAVATRTDLDQLVELVQPHGRTRDLVGSLPLHQGRHVPVPCSRASE